MLPDWWNRRFMLVEGVISLLLAVAIVVWSERFGGASVIDRCLQGNRSSVYGALASIFGSLLGFVITAVSIVVTSADSRRLALLRKSPHYPTMWRAFMAAIRACALACVCSLIALGVDRDAAPRMWPFYASAGSTIFAAFRLWRCIWVFENIIRLLTVHTD